jgi:hypothetical protein
MTILATALWRRLDRPGHDACRLERRADGWRVTGGSVFRHDAGPANIGYCVDCDADWKTVRGEIRGFLGDRWVEFVVVRQEDAWILNGAPVSGLDHLVDLDLGFTPATNLQQLRRVPIAESGHAQIPVAWLDVDAGELTELPQRYERRGDAAFWYEAPSVGYEGLLELAPDGFIRRYPNLWEAEPAT